MKDAQPFDVAKIQIKTGTVLWVDGPRDADNARAFINMAIMRQGVEDHIFAACYAGQYKAGDAWQGGAELPEPERVGNIERHGSMWFPVGKRGL